MEFSSSPASVTDRDSTAGQGTQRAGLRIAPPSQQPTGVFVVIEMTVLVLVTALAMVAIIVSTNEADRVDPGARTASSVESRLRQVADDALGLPRTQAADPRRANVSGRPR